VFLAVASAAMEPNLFSPPRIAWRPEAAPHQPHLEKEEEQEGGGEGEGRGAGRRRG